MRVLAEFGLEDVKSAADQPSRAVGMAAGAPAVDLAEPAPQHAEIGRAALGEPLKFAGDRVKAEEARSALARGLVREVAHHPGGLGQSAGVLGQRRDQAGAGARAENGQAFR